MKGGKTPLGYTIIEVMIVLAVSGMMFVIAASFINGRQQSTAFTQGVNEMASQVQSTIGQVTDGHYSDVPLQCTFSTGDTDTTGAVSAGQGQNAPCVFLGKVIFMTQDAINYQVFSMAGGRIVPTSNNLTAALLEADPVSVPSLAITRAMPQSLTVYDIISTEPGGTPYSYRQHAAGGNWSTNALGFFQSQGNVDSGGTLVSGIQQVSLVQTWGGTDPHGQYALNPSIRQLETSSICLTDGTRYAEIRLGVNDSGVNSSPLTVNVRMDGTTPC